MPSASVARPAAWPGAAFFLGRGDAPWQRARPARGGTLRTRAPAHDDAPPAPAMPEELAGTEQMPRHDGDQLARVLGGIARRGPFRPGPALETTAVCITQWMLRLAIECEGDAPPRALEPAVYRLAWALVAAALDASPAPHARHELLAGAPLAWMRAPLDVVDAVHTRLHAELHTLPAPLRCRVLGRMACAAALAQPVWRAAVFDAVLDRLRAEGPADAAHAIAGLAQGWGRQPEAAQWQALQLAHRCLHPWPAPAALASLPALAAAMPALPAAALRSACCDVLAEGARAGGMQPRVARDTAAELLAAWPHLEAADQRRTLPLMSLLLDRCPAGEGLLDALALGYQQLEGDALREAFYEIVCKRIVV
jgi:hypothetical protein